jgi:hypothetical protein
MDDLIATFIADVRSKRGRLQEVADATGIHPKVLRNILYGETTDPRGSNKDRLRQFYERNTA